MSANVITFPRVRRPDAIEVQFDLSKWTIAYYQGHRFVSRLGFSSKAAAEAEAKRLAEGGMTWRMGENGTVYIMPDSADGGCWAVAHQSRSEGSDGLLGRHFSLDDAVGHAIRVAKELEAEFSLGISDDDHGGAA